MGGEGVSSVKCLDDPRVIRMGLDGLLVVVVSEDFPRGPCIVVVGGVGGGLVVVVVVGGHGLL